jgi:hypothetical protein
VAMVVTSRVAEIDFRSGVPLPLITAFAVYRREIS